MSTYSSPKVKATEPRYFFVISLMLRPARCPLAKFWKNSTTLGVRRKSTRQTLFFTMPLLAMRRITTVRLVAGISSILRTLALSLVRAVEMTAQPVCSARVLAASSSSRSGSGLRRLKRASISCFSFGVRGFFRINSSR